MKTFLTFFLIAFMILGCSSKKRVVSEQKSLPIWYTNPMQSNASTLYGLGEGKDKDEAIANALSSMLSTLSVSIASEFKTKSVVREGEVNSIQRDSQNEISSQVQRIRISDYQINHIEEFGFQRFLVSLQADKRKIFVLLDKEIKENLLDIQRKEEGMGSLYLLQRLSMLQSFRESVKEMRNTLFVMNSLNPSFDSATYKKRFIDIENRYEELLNQISFSVTGNSDASKILPVVKSGLSEESFRIVKTSRDEKHFRVHINSQTFAANSYGFDLARCAIEITVKDSRDNIVGSKKINITGQSTQGYEIARENVAVKLNKLLQEIGIEALLGLEL